MTSLPSLWTSINGRTPSLLSPVHNLTPCFLKLRFKIILPPTPTPQVVSSFEVIILKPETHIWKSTVRTMSHTPHNSPFNRHNVARSFFQGFYLRPTRITKYKAAEVFRHAFMTNFTKNLWINVCYCSCPFSNGATDGRRCWHLQLGKWVVNTIRVSQSSC
jgi:hypothetical protein